MVLPDLEQVRQMRIVDQHQQLKSAASPVLLLRPSPASSPHSDHRLHGAQDSPRETFFPDSFRNDRDLRFPDVTVDIKNQTTGAAATVKEMI